MADEPEDPVKRFVPDGPQNWHTFWESLTEEERESLRRKADQEHMSLMAIAIEWGACATYGR